VENAVLTPTATRSGRERALPEVPVKEDIAGPALGNQEIQVVVAIDVGHIDAVNDIEPEDRRRQAEGAVPAGRHVAFARFSLFRPRDDELVGEGTARKGGGSGSACRGDRQDCG
jgi:hypothetical protein